MTWLADPYAYAVGFAYAVLAVAALAATLIYYFLRHYGRED